MVNLSVLPCKKVKVSKNGEDLPKGPRLEGSVIGIYFLIRLPNK